MKKLIFFIFIFAQIKISAGIVDTVSIQSEVMQSEFKTVIVLLKSKGIIEGETGTNKK